VPKETQNFIPIYYLLNPYELQLVKIEQFIKDSNERIVNINKEIEKMKAMLPFSEMTIEDFQKEYPDVFHPDKPTIWPHIPEVQPENDPGPPSHH